MLDSMVFDYVSSIVKTSEEEVSASLRRILRGERCRPEHNVDFLVIKFLELNTVQGIHSHLAGSRLVLDLADAERFKNVLFVRNPFKRFVSGFVDKHVAGSFTYAYRPKSFKDGALKIDQLDSHHFAPQASLAYLPRLSYDKVFDIENIDYDYLSSLLGMKVAPRRMNIKSIFGGECPGGLADAPYDNLVKMKATGSMPDYDCFYDEESRALVRKYYAADFDLIQRWLPASVF